MWGQGQRSEPVGRPEMTLARLTKNRNAFPPGEKSISFYDSGLVQIGSWFPGN